MSASAWSSRPDRPLQAALHKGDVTGVNIESIVIAVIGAIIVLFVWRALTRNQAP
jgi:uncharacterized membrane protein YeaQ/YmgE (transglycosylase-associated protein family)